MPLNAHLGVKLGRTTDGEGLSKTVGRELLAAIAKAVAAKQRARLVKAFSHGGHQRHGGQPWAPLDPATIRQKNREGKTTPMIRTGRLRNSIRSVEQVAGTQVTITILSDAPYAVFHQRGIRGRLPRRPVLVFTAQDRREIRQEIVRLANRAINGSGGLIA